MKGLTAKEEEIMGFFWEKGPLFVKEMLAFYEDPKPHFNTCPLYTYPRPRDRQKSRMPTSA